MPLMRCICDPADGGCGRPIPWEQVLRYRREANYTAEDPEWPTLFPACCEECADLYAALDHRGRR